MSPLDRFRIDGNVAVVTGGSRGLGEEIALTFAAAGANVVVAGRDAARLEKVAIAIRDNGVDALPFVGDLTQEGKCEALIAAAVERFGRLDILVNNAGINVRGAIDEVTPDDYRRVFATNIDAPWRLCRAAAPVLRRQRGGRIINIASTLGIVGMANRSLYCSSKGAVVQLTRELAMELAPFGVTVNAICPGPFETEMNKSLTQNPELYEEFARKTAMLRWGKPGELGPVALFLASAAAAYVTGVALPVDGGWTAY